MGVSAIVIILATGGEGHAVTAFDRETGEPRWTSGDDAVSYQTPMVIELAGRAQLITLTNQWLLGLDPETGEILWQTRHSEGDQRDEAAHPTVIDDRRFLVKYARGAKLYEVTDDGVEERSVIPVRFVPMTGEIERQGEDEQ